MHEWKENHCSLAYNPTYGDDRVICMSSIVADDASVATIVVADGNDCGIVGSKYDRPKLKYKLNICTINDII